MNVYEIKTYPELLCIEASAGTGKTTNLALRYLKIIEKENPESIVAITFTNKATNEMKLKILNFLKKIALNISEEIGDLNKFDQALGKKKLEEILYNYHNFRITTIDSFLSLLAKNFTLDFNLPPHPEISLSDEIYLDLSLKAYLDSIKEETEEEKEFLKYFKKIYFIDKNMGWDFYSKIKEEIDKLLKIEKKTGKNLKFEDNEEELYKKDEEVKKILNNLGIEAFKEISQEKIQNYLKGNLKLSEIKLTFLKQHKDKKEAKKTEELKKEYDLLEIKTAKFPSNNIYKGFKRFFADYLNKENTITLDYLIRVLREKIKNFEYPSKYIFIGEKIKHFLIDEFQDTSPLQWDILKPLIEEVLSEDGTSFYIGDKKQAIYSFRGGDYKIFDKPKEEFTNIIKARIENLNINYRSCEKIIDFVKSVFSEENLEKVFSKEEIFLEKLKKHFEIIKNSKTEKKTGGYVRVDVVPEEENRMEEVEEIVISHLIDLIKGKILEHFNLEDITILVRSNKEARDILSYLLENDIPAISPSALGILSCQRIIETLSFLSFLKNKEDNLSFASFLFGDIFTKKTNTKLEEWQRFVFDLSKNKSNYNLYYSFKKDFSGLYEKYLKDLISFSDILNPYEIVSKFFETFDVLKNFNEEEGFFYAFLEYVLKCQEEELFKLDEIVSKIKNENQEPSVLFPETGNAIKIMTIHKAKGLEFPVVLLPFLKINKFKSNQANFYIENIDFISPLHLNKDKAKEFDDLNYLYKIEHTKYIIDEMNILYVALTRAKEALYIIVPNLKENLYIFPISKETFELGELSKKNEEKKTKEKKKKFLYQIRENWAEKLSREFVDLEIYKDKQRYEKVKEGIEKHKKIECGKYEEIPKNFKEILFPENFIGKEFEKEIVDENGEIYRVDLIIHFKDKIQVIDFKFGEKRESHIEQMKKYIKIIREIEKKEIEGFILYFENEEVLKINE